MANRPISELTGVANPTSLLTRADGDGRYELKGQGSGTIANGDMGDITISSGTWTIDGNAVTLSKLAQIPTQTVLGRTSAGAGNVQALTATELTSILNSFTTSLKGLVPASGGGTTNFLRADGTWAAPAAASVNWGSVGGTLTSQTDLQTALDGKQSLSANLTSLAGLSLSGNTGLVVKVNGTGTGFTLASDLNTGSTGGSTLADANYGDITVSASGTILTINNGAVSPAKMANLAASSFLGNTSLSSAAPAAISVAQAKTLLNYTKSDFGLGNVDNTSDANKPISTATQTALDAKLNASAASAFGLTLLDDADAITARTTLGLGTAATSNSSAFAAAAHTHTIANVTNLQTSLDAKLNATAVSTYGFSLIDDADAATARTTLGLGTAATSAASAFATATHTHAITDVTGLQTSLQDKYSKGEVDALLDDKADANHNHTDVYQPRDDQLDSLAALNPTGNGGKVVAINSGGTGFELVTAPTSGSSSEQWIILRTTATGSSQTITLYEPIEEQQVALYASGIFQDPGVDFTVSGTTLTTTQPSGVKLLVRYRGTILGAIPSNTVSPVISGTASVGQTLTISSNGTWSGSPTSYLYSWRRDGVYISGETGSTYLLNGSDVGKTITARVTASNSFGSGVAFSNGIGPVAAPSGLTAPVVTLTSAAGAAPKVDITFAADIYPGYYLRIQRTNVGTGSAGNYTAPTLDVEHPLTATEVATQTINNADLVNNDGYSDPTGAYWQRYRWEREDGVTSAWSNEIYGTVSVSIAAFYSTTGANKTQYLNMSGTPVLSGVMNNSPNGPRSVRATVPVASSKTHFEVTIDSLYSGTSTPNGSIVCGLGDPYDSGTTLGNLNASSASQPSFGASFPGFRFMVKKGVTSTTIQRNGSSVSATALDAAPAVGDVIVVEYDNTAKTFTIKYKTAATGTTKTITSGTLTSQIPTTPTAYVGGYLVGDGFTANFGGTAFAVTPTSGYDFYA